MNVLHSCDCEKFVYNHNLFENLEIDGVEPQTHDFYELIFVKHGELSYSIEDKVYRVRENGIIFTRPGMLHRITFLNKDIYERYDILFSEKIIFPEVLKKIPDGTDVLHLKQYKHIEQLFSAMDFYCTKFEGEALENILSHLADEIFYYISIELKNTDAENSYSVNPMVTKAIEIIEKNLSGELSLELICKELFITKGYLNKLFNRYLKISPAKYITSKRLSFAQKELRLGANPTEVFARVGFSEYSTFYRSYKAYFGYPPSEEQSRVAVRRIDF